MPQIPKNIIKILLFHLVINQPVMTTNENWRIKYEELLKKLPNKPKNINRKVEMKPGEFPWMVRIDFNETSGNLHKPSFCGGSLINDEWILSAAHCLYKYIIQSSLCVNTMFLIVLIMSND